MSRGASSALFGHTPEVSLTDVTLEGLPAQPPASVPIAVSMLRAKRVRTALEERVLALYTEGNFSYSDAVQYADLEAKPDKTPLELRIMGLMMDERKKCVKTYVAARLQAKNELSGSSGSSPTASDLPTLTL